MSEAFSPSPIPPGEGQLIVPGSPPAKKRTKKVINLLNRTPSPVILEDYGALEPSRCTVGGPGIAGGIVGIATNITVTARDARGIHIREGGEKFILHLQHPSKGSVCKTYESIDHGDGHYTFTSVRADLKGMHQVRLALKIIRLHCTVNVAATGAWSARSCTSMFKTLLNMHTDSAAVCTAFRGGKRLACR
jgi:hypothetical protein